MQIVEFKSKSKLIISKEVLAQVSYLHHKVGNIEWSGLVFYKIVSGDITEPSSLVLKCERLYLMDIGTAAYTEYSPDESIVDFYTKYPEAQSMKWGMLHTHHNMKAYFSGTDNEELVTNAGSHNFYLSLIVNYLDGGNFCAKIGIIADVEIETKYSFKHGLDFKALENLAPKTAKQLLTIDCDIEYDLDDLDIIRYNTIREKKLNKHIAPTHVQHAPYPTYPSKKQQTSFNFDEGYVRQYIPKTPKEIERYLAKAISLDNGCEEPLKVVLDELQKESLRYGEQFPEVYVDSFDFGISSAYYNTFNEWLPIEHHNEFFKQCIMNIDKYRMSGYDFYDLIIDVFEMYIDIEDAPKTKKGEESKKVHFFSGIDKAVDNLDKKLKQWKKKEQKQKQLKL